MNYAAVVQTLGSLALLALALSLLLTGFLVHRRGFVFGPSEADSARRLLLACAWCVSIIAMGGSLYFSEIVGFPPCLLCWYQRIAMYPLVLILGVATLTSDWRAWRYALPLAAVGLVISAHHYGTQLRPALATGACSADVPCTTRHVAVHGFISIPFMAGSAFLTIGLLALAARKSAVTEDGPNAE